MEAQELDQSKHAIAYSMETKIDPLPIIIRHPD
jgi:hypothetical protein